MDRIAYPAIAVALPISGGGSFRHRIKEIKIKPTPSKRPVELELLVDNQKFHTFPPIKPGDKLHWDLRSLPHDVRETSRITIRVTEKRFLHHNRVLSTTYMIRDVAGRTSATLSLHADPSQQQSRAIYSLSARSSLTIEFPDPKEIEEAYTVALARARNRADDTMGPLANLGNAQQIFKMIIDFGMLAAEFNPVAKLVVSLFDKTWQYLEQLQQHYDDTKKLIEGLGRLLPFVKWAKEHVKDGALKEIIPKLLNLIEDASNFVQVYLCDHVTARIIRDSIGASASERLGDLTQRFTDFKDDFDRGVRGELLNEAIMNKQRALLDRLGPTSRSHYSKTQLHLNPTQNLLLPAIQGWTQRQDPDQKLLWVHGHASLNNCSLSAAICERLDAEKTLGSHFFCKDGDPDLRSPDHVLNTLVYRLATRYKPYGEEVAAAIENNIELPTSSLAKRYAQLVEGPLRKLEETRQPKPESGLVILIDSLDECEQGGDRELLLTYLRFMSLVPWIKVIITSAPELDIKASFTINLNITEN